MIKWVKHMVLGLLLIYSVGAHAQAHGFSAGLRGGANLWQGSELKSTAGLSYGLDLSYSCRWFMTRDFALGPKIGISVAHSAGGFSEDGIASSFTNYDYLGHPMDYSIRANAKQTISNWQAELPIMLSLNIHRFILNIGGKFLYMFSGKTTQTISNADIRATYTEFNVEVANELITGLLRPDQLSYTGDSKLPTMHALVGAELGYEWEFGEHHFIGLSLYANYAVWSNGTNSTPTPLITVDAIRDPLNPVPAVHVSPLQANSSALHYMDFGLKLYYLFETEDSHFHGWHRR